MRVYNLRSALQKPEFVTGLYLNRMELREVPPEVFRLPNLRELDLSYNRIAVLPEEIGRLAQLEKLVLSYNALDRLPVELGRLRALHELRLDHNHFQRWPEVLEALSALETLHLSSNQLDGLPEWAEPLQGLKNLDLGDNRLKKLPAGIGSWSSLRVLILKKNRLGRLPSALAACEALDCLDLSENRLSTLPPSLAGLTEIRLLDISRNRFAELPEAVLAWTHLRQLVAARNRLEALPEQIGRLQWLSHLDLSRNRLRQLPARLSTCGHLQVLLLEKNGLEALPPLSGLSRLRRLDVSRNELRDWPDLPAGLKQCSLSRNRLTACPPAIGRQRALESLDLSHNPISSLPETFVELQQLQRLDLRRTELSGWPASLIELDALKVFKSDWPVARHRAFFRLLRACVQAGVPAEERRQLQALWLEAAIEVTAAPWPTLFWAANLKYPELRRLVRNELFRRRGQAVSGLSADSRLCVVGKTVAANRSLRTRLEAQGIAVLPHMDASVTHVLLGEFPGRQPALEDFAGAFLTEAQVVNWLDQRERRYLRAGVGSEEIDRLRALLLHEDAVNVQLALRMMQGGGVPPVLLTELLIAWKKCKPGKLRRELKQLLWQYAPESARRVLEKPLSLSKKQPEALLRANIARVCAGTPFEEDKLLRAAVGG